MRNLLNRLIDYWYRPRGCVCEIAVRSARNRHNYYSSQGMDAKCIRRWVTR